MMHGTQRILTVKDVPADDFIRAFSQHLKTTQKIKIPKVKSFSPPIKIFQWFNFVKSGPKRELAPYNPDWLYIRAGNRSI